jgi:hypothetical protein
LLREAEEEAVAAAAVVVEVAVELSMILGGIVNRKDFNLFSLQLATCQSKK